MKIAVLSGKGGTGKTFVSVNLASVYNNSCYIDCDVEEPNGHLFFKPNNLTTESINVSIPEVDDNLCSGCRKCTEFCKFNALAYIKNKIIVFEDICHSCGGCKLICPNGAIKEKNKTVGEIQQGYSKDVHTITGLMYTGEESGVPIIKKLINRDLKNKLTIIDCPPGSGCSVMESIKNADYCILVGEPTLFGAHNLNMVYKLVKLFNKPFGVILNKYLGKENPTEKFCNENNIKIIEKISFNNEIGRLNSDAVIVVREKDKYKELFENILKTVLSEVQHEEAFDSQR